MELEEGGKGKENDRISTILKYICASRGYSDMY
jgi:hypothetical protein